MSHTFFTITSPIRTGGAATARWIAFRQPAISAFGTGRAVFTLIGARRPATFTSAGGVAPYTWSATGLPAGMSLSPAGVLFGFAPYEVGSYAEGCYFVQLDWTTLKGVLAMPPELGIAAAGR